MKRRIPWPVISEWLKTACFFLIYGVLLFWAVQSAQAAAPNAPSNPSPANDSTGVSVDAVLTWSCTDPDNDTLEYAIKFYHEEMPPFSEYAAKNMTSASYNPFFLYYNTTYYWQVTATDNTSASTEGPLWHFTTTTYTFEDDNYSALYEEYFNFSEEGGVTFTGIYEGVQAVYNTVIPAGLFYLFMFSLIFGGIWIKQGDVTIPAILGLILAPLLWTFIPMEYQYACYWLFVISIGGLIASIFKARQ